MAGSGGEMEQELQFPIEFTNCPCCGSTERLAEIIANQEKEKGKISKTAHGAVIVQKSVIADPNRLALSAPVLVTFLDICANCGTVYCVHAELIITAYHN
jgi:uncharacterized Zn finger protein